MAQIHPCENGQGPSRFRRWYVDEISGAMMPEDDAVRDLEGHLVDRHDVDHPGRDDLMEHWEFPADDDPPGPDEVF